MISATVFCRRFYSGSFRLYCLFFIASIISSSAGVTYQLTDKFSCLCPISFLVADGLTLERYRSAANTFIPPVLLTRKRKPDTSSLVKNFPENAGRITGVSHYSLPSQSSFCLYSFFFTWCIDLLYIFASAPDQDPAGKHRDRAADRQTPAVVKNLSEESHQQ